MDGNEMCERIIIMETKMANYEYEVREIKKTLNNINTQLSRIGWGLAATFGGLMFQLLITAVEAKK